MTRPTAGQASAIVARLSGLSAEDHLREACEWAGAGGDDDASRRESRDMGIFHATMAAAMFTARAEASARNRK